MKDLISSESSNLPNTAKSQERGFSLQSTNKANILFKQHLARELWATFDYVLPITPGELASFVITQIDIAGYKLVKDEDNGSKEQNAGS